MFINALFKLIATLCLLLASYTYIYTLRPCIYNYAYVSVTMGTGVAHGGTGLLIC